jgi:hypothetical protein
MSAYDQYLRNKSDIQYLKNNDWTYKETIEMIQQEYKNLRKELDNSQLRQLTYALQVWEGKINT